MHNVYAAERQAPLLCFVFRGIHNKKLTEEITDHKTKNVSNKLRKLWLIHGSIKLTQVLNYMMNHKTKYSIKLRSSATGQFQIKLSYLVIKITFKKKHLKLT